MNDFPDNLMEPNFLLLIERLTVLQHREVMRLQAEVEAGMGIGVEPAAEAEARADARAAAGAGAEVGLRADAGAGNQDVQEAIIDSKSTQNQFLR